MYRDVKFFDLHNFPFSPSDLHVPAAAWSVLLSQEENPPQRPKASEPAHQRQGRAQTGRLR